MGLQIKRDDGHINTYDFVDATSLVSIPDLWHIAEHLAESDNPRLQAQSKKILDVWHLSHDLLDVMHGRSKVINK